MSNFLQLEKKKQKQGYKIIAGADEAGRGPLAGPVVAAFVILTNKIQLPRINDSKLLSEKKRTQLYNKIIKNGIFSVDKASNKEIDRFGILKATNLAFKRALKGLILKPDFFFIDGRDKFNFPIEFESVIKGDSKVKSIMAASIVAKVERDRIMSKLPKKYQIYNFRKHKGYGTKEHYKLIKKFGPSDIHRKTFRLK